MKSIALRRRLRRLPLRNLSSFDFKFRCQTLNKYFYFFIFSHSPFDVGRSMFDVHSFP